VPGRRGRGRLEGSQEQPDPGRRHRRAPAQPVAFVEGYYFDLPFYARLRQPVPVLDDWDDPRIAARDNWRRELVDAGQFAPAVVAQRLVLPAVLGQPGNCPGRRSWVVGPSDLGKRWPQLADAAPVATTRELALWDVRTGRRRRRPAPERPAGTEHVGHGRHPHQHQRQRDVVPGGGIPQQAGVRQFVDGEPGRGQREEARRRLPHRRRAVAERQAVLAGERHHEGHQPAGHVGGQRRRPAGFDHAHHDGEVHRGRGGADGDEGGDAAQRRHARVRPAMRRIVLCIDDYALRPGVDAAVLELAARGLVSATSCLVGSPRWPAAAAALRAVDRSNLDVGLHLDFTEAPFDASLRHGLGDFIARAYLRRLPADRLAREIRAQFDAFEQAMGRAPDHVDGHQHVHQLPGCASGCWKSARGAATTPPGCAAPPCRPASPAPSRA
jgi:hypothetical protein